jgi:AraC family transcriptional regulator of arabinose operon
MEIIKINHVLHRQRQPIGYRTYRQHGSGDYAFVHFFSSVNIIEHENIVETMPNACIIYSNGSAQDFEAILEPLLHDWIHFTPPDAELFYLLGIPLNTLFYMNDPAGITELVAHIELLFINHPPFYELSMYTTILNLFIFLSHSFQDSRKTSHINQQHRDRFEQLRLTVYSSPADWTVDKMASKLGFSRSQFTALYNSYFSKSPGNDLINATMDSARYLLSSTDYTISEIASQVGYESVEHFIRFFKTKNGCTPNAFRKGLRW